VKSPSLEHGLDGAFRNAAKVGNFLDTKQFTSGGLGGSGLFQTPFEEFPKVLGVECGVVEA
jgi:hypothetical protein